jgi:transglutaminase-like putative cysteine protease
MDFSFGCRLAYRLDAPTPFVFNLEAACEGGQTIREERLALPSDLPVERWTMPESGNRYLRVVAGPGEFRVEYRGAATLSPRLEDPDVIGEVPPGELPFEVYPHLYPSRYCQADRLEGFARKEFGELPRGYRRVEAICDWIHGHVDYESGASDASTSAVDTVAQRAGVCRDFAHLAIALCRASGIPARYVSAYAWRLDPPDFHAVVEAWLQGPEGRGGWYLFDPTRLSAPEGIVRIGVGRDAAEVAFSSPFGPFEAEKPEVWITVAEDAGEAMDPRAAALRLGG